MKSKLKFTSMPDPGLISAASSFAPSPMDYFNVAATMYANHQNRKFSEKMYQRQYEDSIKFWEMQNAYNTPAMQMQRYQDAGLNPHLIYGQGNSGNASPIPTPDTMPVNHREARIEGNDSSRVAQSLLLNADLRIKNAQADNLEVQNDVIQQDAVLRRWQAERAGYDLGFERDTYEYNFDARREAARKIRTETDTMIDRNAREAALNASNIQEAAERMLNMAEQRKSMPLERGRIRADTDRIRENISLMQKEGKLREFEIALRQQGINPSDPLWARYVGMFLSDIADGRVTPGTIAQSVWSWLFK